MSRVFGFKADEPIDDALSRAEWLHCVKSLDGLMLKKRVEHKRLQRV